MRNWLFSATAMAAISAVSPVWAQAQEGAPAAQSDARSQGGLADIVVTAQRRAESAQKAAIAIDAVSADTLLDRGILKAEDITKTAPSISITNGGGTSTSIFIRGVGNITVASYFDPAVTPNYDGVVLGRAAGAFGAAFYDLERVEVLKGPQGILYGRNATGGAINVIPAKPVLGEFSGGFNLSYGNYDAVAVDAHVNAGIGENAALRIAASRQRRDGFNRDGTDDLDRSALRGQLLFEPSSDLSIRLAADYTKIGGVGPGGNYYGAYTPDGTGGYVFSLSGIDPSEGFLTPLSNAYRQTLLVAPGFGFADPLNQYPSLDASYWGVNGEINWKTSIGTVTVIPAYRHSKALSYFNGPAFNTGYYDEKTSQKSLEARLAGSSGPIDYIVGGFYFNEEIKGNDEFNQEFILPIQIFTQKTESLAAFGQLTGHVSDRFRLVGGLRYTHDKKEMDGFISNFIVSCGPGLAPPASFAAGCAAPGALPHFPNYTSRADVVNWLVSNGWIAPGSTSQPNPQFFPLLNGLGAVINTLSPTVGDLTFSRLTWKASAEFDLGPRSLLYATVESGYRAGGLQQTDGRPVYRPEYITAYTIGSKNRFFNNKVQLNIEGFYWKYKDQQINYFTVDPSGTLINSTENAGRATVKGIDVDLMARPMRYTTLTAKVQYLKATYKELHLYTAAPFDNFNCPFTLTGQVAGGAPVKDFDCSGRPLLNAPEWTINLGGEQVVPLSSALELAGQVNSAYRSAAYGGFEFLDFEKISGYWQTDIALTLRDSDRSWALTAFLNNLEDKRRVIYPQLSPFGAAVYHYGAPQTYGVRFSADF